MTLTKRILCIALTLALGLALFAPGVSAADDPNAPVITQPLPTAQVYTRVGLNLRLNVRAQLPEGVEGTLSYAWWYEESGRDNTWTQIASATDENLVMKMTMDMLFTDQKRVINHERVFRVVVTNTYIDEAGNEQTASATSETTVTLLFGVIEFFALLPRADISNINLDELLVLLALASVTSLPYMLINNIYATFLAYIGTFSRWIRYK